MQKLHWTKEQDDFIRKNWQTMTDEELGAKLNRTEHAVFYRRRALGCKSHRKWTDKDDEYLANAWGTVSKDQISKHLGRSLTAVSQRASSLRLGRMLDTGSFVTFNELVKAYTGRNNGHNWLKTVWIDKNGLPTHRKKLGTAYHAVVIIDEFWEWADRNRYTLDFTKLEPLLFGEEPAWVQEQRRVDFLAKQRCRQGPWSKDEEQRLIDLVEQYRYTWTEISRIIGRSYESIANKLNRINTKARPLKDEDRKIWSQDDLNLAADMIRKGYSLDMIGDACSGRSGKSVYGKCCDVYKTGDLNKIRAMLGKAGPWGTGAPKETTWRKRDLKRVKEDVAKLAELLQLRELDLMRRLRPWASCWQKEQCQHWDPVNGCTHSMSCDSCQDYRKIQPQYCEICGCEIISRTPAKFCRTCLLAWGGKDPRRKRK